MEMTRSHTGDCLITRSPPTRAPITQLMRSFMWSFGSIPSTQTLSGSGVVPPSVFTASLLHLWSICSSNDDFYETEEGGSNWRINPVTPRATFLRTVCAVWRPLRPVPFWGKETGTGDGPVALKLKITRQQVCVSWIFKGCQNLCTSNAVFPPGLNAVRAFFFKDLLSVLSGQNSLFQDLLLPVPNWVGAHKSS